MLSSSIAQLAKAAALKSDVVLQPHQERVRDKLKNSDRLLLYHGLGTGKSLSSLAAAESLASPYGVVVPASLRANYQKEVDKFTDSSPEILSYTGVGMGKQFKDKPDTLIFDEAHRLRNPETSAAKASKTLANKANKVLLLTGTPITNAPSDLASLLSVLNDKPISPATFNDKFVGRKKVYPDRLSRLLGRYAGEENFVNNENVLRGLLKNKVDYQPSKTPEGVNVDTQTIKVPMSEAQFKFHNAVRSGIPAEWAWKLDKEFPLSRAELNKLNAFLTGLRQSSLSTQPFRKTKDYYTAFEESNKLKRALTDLKQELEKDPRKKSIIYSNYIDAGIMPYASALEREGIPHGVYHGGIPSKTREEILQQYNKGDIRALLLGPAGSEGISTKGTNLIQLLDPHWHESRSNQAAGRGLRFDSHIGLPEDLKNVAIRKYISETPELSFMQKILGYKKHKTGDEILEAMAAKKELLNEQFRKILQEEGIR
jgi:SNF2 family DNA or RNA helicase